LSKTFNITKARQGSSPYSLNITNDFVSFVTNSEGVVTTDHYTLTTHTIEAYYGDTKKDVTIGETDPISNSGLYIKYIKENVEVNVDPVITNKTVSANITNLTADTGNVLYELYDCAVTPAKKVAVAKFEVVKIKKGDSTDSYWLSPDVSTVTKDENGNISPAVINFTIVKKSGLKEPEIVVADGNSLSLKINKDGYDYNSTPVNNIYSIPTENLANSIVIELSHQDTLVDKETIKIVKDGTSAISYSLVASTKTISIDKNGNRMPEVIEFTALKSTGKNIETLTDATIYYTQNDSNINLDYSDGFYKLTTADLNLDSPLVVYLQVDSLQVDKETIIVVKDGQDGKDGSDAESPYVLNILNDRVTALSNTSELINYD
jgi:hypothetical protein